MIPLDDNPLTPEEIERWPALGFYLSVLEHLAPGAVRITRAPQFAEHTDEILRELGKSDDELIDLKLAGAAT